MFGDKSIPFFPRFTHSGLGFGFLPATRTIAIIPCWLVAIVIALNVYVACYTLSSAGAGKEMWHWFIFSGKTVAEFLRFSLQFFKRHAGTTLFCLSLLGVWPRSTLALKRSAFLLCLRRDGSTDSGYTRIRSRLSSCGKNGCTYCISSSLFDCASLSTSLRKLLTNCASKRKLFS